MAAELTANFADVDLELVESGDGIFDVTADGKLLYSKYDTGRFPNDGEVSELLRRSGGAAS